MRTFDVNINGYLVELELYLEDGDERSNCDITKGRFTASLACLDATGRLTDTDNCDEHEVSARTITEISDWADANGY